MFQWTQKIGGSGPALEKIIARGLQYSRFHTTSLCSPTRQALLTGRNHHSAGMGNVADLATGSPGYSSIRPNSVAVTDDYPEGSTNKFSGKIHWVRVELEGKDMSHLEPVELKHNRIMARQ